MTDHTDLRNRIEDHLKDSGNADWSTSEIDNALRIALHELSVSLPSRSVATVDAVDGQYEYSLSGISGLVEVVEVWYPYLSTDDTYKKAHPCKWRMLDDSTLYLEVDEDPDATYDLRIFFDLVQLLNGLDGASSTTLNEAEKSALVIGAAGYAAVALAVDKVDTIVIGGSAPEDLRKWGWARITEFRQRVYDLAVIQDAGEDSRIGWWSADKWDD
jgi:hypothetical protein